MKSIKSKLMIIIFISSMNMQIAFAYSWPVFAVPHKKTLLELDLIDRSNCPIGQGKIKAKSFISIHDYLCLTFCPKEWYWHVKADNDCHNLQTGFELQEYKFSYDRDKDGFVNYSRVTAKYGNKNEGKTAFKFVFKSAPGEHWYCVTSKNNEGIVICANDT